jgi:hypothetical protein
MTVFPAEAKAASRDDGNGAHMVERAGGPPPAPRDDHDTYPLYRIAPVISADWNGRMLAPNHRAVLAATSCQWLVAVS